MRRLIAWLDQRIPLAKTGVHYLRNYYVPKNFNFFYLFGSILLVLLANQCLSGLWLTMFYTPNADRAFASVEYIMRDVPYGWLLRYLHSTGASALFVALYLHLFRALLYGSYKEPRELVWLLGMGLFLLLLLEAFLGYLLPWGQMSYWGAQVLTSLLGAIPWVGDFLTTWVRGDFVVSNPTLQRFFALHSIGLIAVIVLMVFIHVVALHQVGANNPEGIEIKGHLDKQGRPLDGIPFHPYYVLKDSVAVLGFLLLFFSVVFFIPDMGGLFLDRNNFVPADPLMTPNDIKPLWYLAPFYSFLRAIPSQLAGITVLLASFLLFFFLPWLDKSPVRSMRYKGAYSRVFLAVFVVSVLLLTYLGLEPLSLGRIYAARLAIVGYFSYFLLMPFYSRYERTKAVPERIST